MTVELSLNQATTRPYPLTDTARAASAVGIRHLGLWCEPVRELGAGPTARLLRDTGLGVTSLSRVGFVADKRGPELRAALDEVAGAIELAHAVGAPMLTFIAGGLPTENPDPRAAEARVADALAQVEPLARAAGVRLALEPLHPLFAADRSAVTTLRAALRTIAELPPQSVGVLIDSYATWWDPDLAEGVEAAGPRIAGYQVSDFRLPLPAPDHMNGRLLPGDGIIDLARMTTTVRAAGFTGPIEVEVFNDEIWTLPLADIVARTVQRFETHVASGMPYRR
ncbi:sugar phosphate isomerase/epimerase family protein [Pseudonocardia acaciae]|uniref:sugar phosphate isomerase/epimerase family protein n=1 Tax=Pseudonocardia acaciae TaxID=551276 RepID=UPI00048E9DB2|nr:sugar phosphate isomerase/epimerase family protein [Pseudonocardia acaciae]